MYRIDMLTQKSKQKKLAQSRLVLRDRRPPVNSYQTRELEIKFEPAILENGEGEVLLRIGGKLNCLIGYADLCALQEELSWIRMDMEQTAIAMENSK